MTRQIKLNKKSFSFILVITMAASAVLYSACSKDDDKPAASCSDGIQNQGETGTDCGGPCTACPSCSDGILNQGETSIDCGGPCAACPTATCSDGIQNQGETGIDCGGPCPSCAASLTASIDGAPFTASLLLQASHLAGNTLLITATNGIKMLSLYYSGAFAPGTYPLQVVATAYASSSLAINCPCSSGTITFTTFNTTTQKIAGTFNFVCTDSATVVNHNITNGSFQNLTYN